MTISRDIDEDDEDIEDEDEDVEDEDTPKRSNPLRLILLVLLALIVVCVVCSLVGPAMLGSALPSLSSIPALSSLPGFPTGEPTTVPAIESPVITPTGDLGNLPQGETPPSVTGEIPITPTEELSGLPPEETPPPVTGAEQPIGAQEPTAEQPLPTKELTPEEPSSVAPTEELEGGESPVESTVTAIPVPGPTATPTLGPAVDTECVNNQSPAADAGGPYEAMMGKGQAFITVDGSGSSDPDGTIISYEWDFGDGSLDSGQSTTYGYSSTGDFVVTLTVTDNCGETAMAGAEVTIIGPTPPLNDNTFDNDSSPAAPGVQQPSNAGNGAVGFCYRVQPGDTLSGLASYFGVPLSDLAAVNGVSVEYLVIADQGLFIPIRPPQPGFNFYEVQPEDTLYDIAFRCGLTVNRLAEANSLTPEQALTPGQMIIVPPWSWN